LKFPRSPLAGRLVVPPDASALVVYARDGGGEGLRDETIASRLHREGISTLLLDLLTPDEVRLDAIFGRLRGDVELLARRLIRAVDWLRASPDVGGLPLGIIGGRTGAAASIVAAAERPHAIGAIVSQSGAPDLAGDAIPKVRAPTLFVAAGLDAAAVGSAQKALHAITATARLQIVPDASHRFEEPGALERVAALATDWFAWHLARRVEANPRSESGLA
jgi:putative phosphoribosyl transferase